MSLVDPITLTGAVVRLEPLSHHHEAGILAAAAEDRSTYGLAMVPKPDPAVVRVYIDTALAAQSTGTVLPFATVRVADGKVVGSTRFLAIERYTWPFGRAPDPAEQSRTAPNACEIGGTWLAASAQRTAINTEAKYLMARHAFETWEVDRLLLKTDERNTRSRANIERIGATFEGILRANMYAADAGLRNSAYYSILRSEWPAVKTRLEDLLRAY